MKITPRVKEILSWYSSDSPGTLTNLARLLGTGRLGGTGKLVILPVDQGFEHGPARSFAPNPPGYDPDYHFQLAIEAGCNAYAAPLGFLEAGAAKFAGQIPLILKLNNSDSLSKLGGAPISAVTGGVRDAVRLGCSAIGYTIYPGSDARNAQLEHLRIVGLALDAAVPRAVVVGAVAAVLAVGVVVLLVVGDEVGEREAVVGRDQVDRGGRSRLVAG
jgi:class I fructose-bisphosphate aldolase